MSETERLAMRLEAAKAIGFHVSWGPDAAELTADERAGVINRVLDEAAADAADVVIVPRSTVKAVYAALIRLHALDGWDLKDGLPDVDSADFKLRRHVGDLTEFNAMLLGQCLPRDEQKAIDEAWDAEQDAGARP